MSANITELTERQLKWAVIKLATLLVAAVAFVAWAVTFLADEGKDIALHFAVISFALTFLANGVLAILHIVDWFEARKRRNG